MFGEAGRWWWAYRVLHGAAVRVSGQGPGSGGPGEFHPRAPTERSVTVSRHSALVILIISGYLTQAQWAEVVPAPVELEWRSPA